MALPPRIPSIILENEDEDTIEELASTMDPGVIFSTQDHRLIRLNRYLIDYCIVPRIRVK